MRQIPRPVPSRPAARAHERVSILIPARNEAHRITPTLVSVLAQEGIDDLEILILDDGSTDGTGEIAESIAAGDPRVKVIHGVDDTPPDGWRGKPWACHRLSEHATGSVLVFIDADVVLHSQAVAVAVRELRERELQLVSPYPQQLAHGPLERLTQPLVTWSAFTTLPMALARGTNPAFSAAIGQFLVVDTHAYRDSGGHAAVAAHIVEDVEVLRALKRQGYRGIPMNGGDIASCRMYVSNADLYEGYTKSLWSIFGNTPGAVGGIAALLLFYTAPPVIALTSRDAAARRWGMAGYAAGVASRAMVARQTGERVWPDAFTQPASTAAFAALTVASIIRRRRGTLTWKGRSI